MALSKGMTALRAALGAVGGGLEGYAQMRALEQKRQQEQEAARMQQDMFRLNLIQATGGRLGMPTQAAAPTAPAMAMPATDTVLQRALTRTQKQEFGPLATPRTAAAMEPGRRQALGMETPPLARTSLGALLDQQTGKFGIAEQAPASASGTSAPIRLATQPAAPQRQRVTLGGQEFEITPGETPAEKTKRELDLYRQQKLIDVELAGQKTKAEADAAKAAKEQRVQTLMQDAGMTRKDAVQVVELEAKYGDVVVTPSARLTAETARRGQDITARGQQLSYDAAMARVEQEKATPASDIEKRLPVGARNDIADYNAAIRTLQEAEKEVANNPGAFGLKPAMFAKGGTLGRSLREQSEGAQSEAYTKARAQMQSALMKLRKTQFGTQMTRLEKETGEEVFPSGAESPQRLAQMLTVLVGNAEQLRRGVYEANNAADLYQPIAPAEKTPPTTPTPSQPTMTLDQWMDANPQRPGETDAQYEARYRASVRGGR